MYDGHRWPDLILLLLTPDYLALDGPAEGSAISKAVRQLDAGEAYVVPILIKRCSWQATQLADLSILPADGKPIIGIEDPETRFNDTALDLMRLITELT